jgi:hypothetical protein
MGAQAEHCTGHKFGGVFNSGLPSVHLLVWLVMYNKNSFVKPFDTKSEGTRFELRALLLLDKRSATQAMYSVFFTFRNKLKCKHSGSPAFLSHPLLFSTCFTH